MLPTDQFCRSVGHSEFGLQQNQDGQNQKGPTPNSKDLVALILFGSNKTTVYGRTQALILSVFGWERGTDRCPSPGHSLASALSITHDPSRGQPCRLGDETLSAASGPPVSCHSFDLFAREDVASDLLLFDDGRLESPERLRLRPRPTQSFPRRRRRWRRR